jgi:hypothetical protein
MSSKASPGLPSHFTLLMLLSGLALLPLGLVDIPPLVDYLNHIARDYVLAHFDESNIFPRFYRPQWAFLPNLAMDAAIVPLAKFVSIDLAGKLFLAAVFLLTIGGVFALSFVLHGRIEWPAYLVFFFLYHRLILWGYLNFSFGIALALLGFACWLLLQHKSWTLRLVVFTLFAITLLLSHLFAFAVYLLFIGGYQLGQTVKNWRVKSLRQQLNDWSLILLHVIVPVLIFIALSPTAEKSGSIRFGSFLQKLTSAFHVVNNYYRPLDYATFAVLVGTIGLGLWKRWLTLAEPVLWPLIIGGLLQLGMPETLFGSQTADSRLPIALWMLLAAGLKLNPERFSFAKPVFLALLALAAARLGVVAVEWRRANPVYEEYLAAFEKIEPGAKLLSVVPLPRNPSFHHPPLNFIASRAVIGKSAFDPFMFADYGHQPLGFTEPYLALSKVTPGPILYYNDQQLTAGRPLKDWENPFRDEILRKYDYLLLINGGIFNEASLNHIQSVYSGSNFVLYRITQ